jgi:hypothetical protein
MDKPGYGVSSHTHAQRDTQVYADGPTGNSSSKQNCRLENKDKMRKCPSVK